MFFVWLSSFRFVISPSFFVFRYVPFNVIFFSCYVSFNRISFICTDGFFPNDSFWFVLLSTVFFDSFRYFNKIFRFGFVFGFRFGLTYVSRSFFSLTTFCFRNYLICTDSLYLYLLFCFVLFNQVFFRFVSLFHQVLPFRVRLWFKLRLTFVSLLISSVFFLCLDSVRFGFCFVSSVIITNTCLNHPVNIATALAISKQT